MNRRVAAALLIALAFSACGPITSVPSNDGTEVSQTGAASPTSRRAVTAAATSPAETAVPESLLDVPSAALKGVSIGVWHAWFGPAADLLEKQTEEFNSSNQWGITVSARTFGTYNDLADAVGTTLSGTNQPDVVVALPEQALTWDEQRGVLDLTPYVSDPRWGLPQSEIADFPSPFWKQDQVGNERLGVPAARSTVLLFYNLSWARELGFPNPPASAEEFRQQACAAHAFFLKDAAENNDGYGGWMVDSAPETALGWLYAFGGGVVATGGTYQLRTNENQAALEFLKGMFDDKCAWVSAEPAPYEQFALRRALFITASLSELSDQLRAFRLAAGTDQWTVLPFPGQDGKNGMVVYGPSFSILKSSEAPRQLAAWLFVRWMLSPENQARWVETTGLFPLRSSSLPALDAYRGAHPQWAAAVALLSGAQGTPELTSWRKVKHVLGDGFDALFRQNIPVDRINVLLTQMDQTAASLTGSP